MSRSKSASIGSLFQSFAICDLSMIFDEQVEERIHRLLVPKFCELRQRLAWQWKQLRIVYHADEDCFGTGDLLPFVVPLIRGSKHICTDARARCGILQAFDELGVAAVVRPSGNESGKVVEPGGVGVCVRGDVKALRSRGEIGRASCRERV